MKVPWKFFVVLCSAGSFEVFASSAIWMDSLIEYIRNDVKTYQVTSITDSALSSTVSRTVDEILFKIGENFETLQIDVGGPTELYEDIVSRAVAETSTMFFVLVYVSHERLDIRSSENMINTARRIAAYKSRPRILLVLHSRVMSGNHEEFLRHAWSKQMLDFTIVEIVDAPRRTEQVPGAEINPIIHQFDPFKEQYTRVRWTPSTEWFPNKVKDMRGHILKIGVSNMPPYTFMKKSKGTGKTIIFGRSINLVFTIGKQLNFSHEYVSLDSLTENCNDTYTICLHNLLRSGKVDMVGFLTPHNSGSLNYKILQTSPIRTQELCPVVPILYEAKMLYRPSFFIAYALSFIIIVVFWIASRKLRFQGPAWQVFGLARVLFGISVTREPRSIAERVLFTCLLFVSATYSANLYTAITGISLETRVEREFNTFEDLDRSELVPMISRELYDKTFGDDIPLWANIKKKVVKADSFECLLYRLEHKNVTCLMIKDVAELTIKSIINSGHKIEARIVKPCFWSDSMSFPLAEGSPYRSQINDIIRNLHDSGLIAVNYRDIPTIENGKSASTRSLTDVDQNAKTLRYQLLIVLIVGYTLATIVFLAEIIIH